MTRSACLLVLTVLAGMLMSAAAITATAAADTVVCAPGSAAGQCDDPRAVAVDAEEELLFVTERTNRRVDVFDTDGSFVRAFGWGVADGGAEAQVCELSCQAGVSGDGAGQFGFWVTGIAVDEDPLSAAQHDVYVFDGSNQRVQRFHPDGEFVLTFGWNVNETAVGEGAPQAERNVCTAASGDQCGAGTAGDAAGQFERLDNPIAVGPEGVVYVGGEDRVQKFEPSGELIEVIEPLPPAPGEGLGRMRAIAVGGGGGFYAVAGPPGQTAVRRYDAGGSLLSAFHFSDKITALRLDGSGNLFVTDAAAPGLVIGGGEASGIYEYDTVNAPVRTFYGMLESLVLSIAPYSGAGGDVFAAEPGLDRVLHVPFPAPGPVVYPYPGSTEATAITNRSATLNSRVNPEGESTEFHFEYVEQEAFEEGGWSEAESTPKEEVALDSGAEFPVFELRSVAAAVGCASLAEGDCLLPETAYRFRAVADNASGEDTGPAGTFTTGPALQVLASWSEEVGTETARLSATVDGLGLPVTGHFQYVSEATFLASGWTEAAETEPLDFGPSGEAATRSVQISGLAPGTAYRYRLLGENALIEGTPVAGPEGRLVTYPRPRALPDPDPCPNARFRTGPGARLPGCRAYELVSPLDKANGEIVAVPSLFVYAAKNPPARLDQAAPGGERVTYSSYRPFGASEGAHISSQYLAERVAGSGWDNSAINHPRQGPSLYSSLGKETPYQAFSEDLCSGWFWQDTDLALVPGAPEGVPNLYRRGTPAAGCGQSGYELLTTVAPTQPAPGFSKELDGTDSRYFLMAGGFSADGEASVFRAGAKLTPGAAEADVYQTYLYWDGELHLVSVLPSGEAAGTHSAVGTAGSCCDFRSHSVDNAVSRNADRVFWSRLTAVVGPPETGGVPGVHDDNADAGEGPSRLYARLNPAEPQSAIAAGACTEAATRACTLAISESVSPEAALYWTADPRGSVVIFEITAGPLADTLYEFDVDAAAAAGKAEEAMATPIAGEVMGVLGSSEDASRIYLASREDRDGAGPAQAGEPNVYLYERGGSFSFVGALTDDDLRTGSSAPASPTPYVHKARVTGDGAHLAFMSAAPLTGYDSTVTGSGERAAEVYLYDAAEGRLRCVSCSPSGGRPEGARELGQTVNPFPVAARIPGWESQTHASRVLAADGDRMFFESFEALVLRDTNGRQDVYEWRAAGEEAECEAAGADLFVASAGGCISLISSGEARSDAAFIDASASGSDVFFTTSRSLVPADYGLVDIYDARIGGGFPPPPPPAQPCEGEACQSPPPAPDDNTPASSNYEGQGNLPAPQPNCRAFARRARGLALGARRLSSRAKRSRRLATRLSSARGTRTMRRRARRLARGARRRAIGAKKHRTRARRCCVRARGSAQSQAGKEQR